MTSGQILQLFLTIFANVGTVICFRSGNPADEAMVLPLFSPCVQAGEIANLPTYNFYGRLAAIHSQEPLSGETLLLEAPSDKHIADMVIASSRKKWAKKYEKNTSKMDKTVTENNTEIKNKDIVSNVSDKKVLLIPSKH